MKNIQYRICIGRFQQTTLFAGVFVKEMQVSNLSTGAVSEEQRRQRHRSVDVTDFPDTIEFLPD